MLGHGLGADVGMGGVRVAIEAEPLGGDAQTGAADLDGDVALLDAGELDVEVGLAVAGFVEVARLHGGDGGRRGGVERELAEAPRGVVGGGPVVRV